MNECIITYGDRHYIAKNLTSYTNIRLLWNAGWRCLNCRFEKEFSFGGDKLIISQPFVVSKSKQKDVYDKIVKGWTHSDYPDLSYLEFIQTISREINQEDLLKVVMDESKYIVDLLNSWRKGGLI